MTFAEQLKLILSTYNKQQQQLCDDLTDYGYYVNKVSMSQWVNDKSVPHRTKMREIKHLIKQIIVNYDLDKCNDYMDKITKMRNETNNLLSLLDN